MIPGRISVPQFFRGREFSGCSYSVRCPAKTVSPLALGTKELLINEATEGKYAILSKIYESPSAGLVFFICASGYEVFYYEQSEHENGSGHYRKQPLQHQ